MYYNLCILCFFRVLQEDFLLVSGELKVPVDHINCKVGYKYVVLKETRDSKKKFKYQWEHLINHRYDVNRCLDIPKKKQKPGGKCDSLTVYPDDTL